MHGHPELRGLLDDDAPAPERESSLRHLSGCAECRSRIASEDPSRLFSLLALEPVPAGLLDRLSAGVAASIEGSGSGTADRGFRWGWASIAASLLLAGVFSAYLWDRGGGTVEVEAAVAETFIVEQGREPAFELISSPGTAQVVDLSVGGTRFVMIFDEDLDL